MIEFLSAGGLGFAFCAVPGAVTAQVIRNGVERGFRAAMALQLGALAGVIQRKRNTRRRAYAH